MIFLETHMHPGAIRQSLRYSFKDGLFYSIMFGFGDLFLVAYCIALHGSAQAVALVATLPGFIGALSQLYTTETIEMVEGRKKIINFVVFFQALMWLPIILVPYVAGGSVPVLIACAVAYAVMGAFSVPAWSSLISKYIPVRSRGTYFGWRSKTLGFVVVASNFAAGGVLWLFGKGSMAGFTIIFSAALVCRFVSWAYLTKMYEPPHYPAPEAHFTFWDFIRRSGKSNYARFVFIVGAMSIAVNMASPFFAVYMLRDLKFNYIVFTLITLSATFTSLVMMQRWGKHADVVGNIRVFKTCACVIPVIPLFWLFSHNAAYLMAVQFFSGFFWAGYNMSVSNFIYDTVTPPKRSRCVAYFNVVHGAGIFIGALCGAFLAPRLPAIKGCPLLTLFLLSALLRCVPALCTRFVREVRAVRRVNNADLFYSILGLKKNIVTDID
jgi:MFS family permease